MRMILLHGLHPGERCRLIRTYKKISAELVAQEAGISKFRLSRFENKWGHTLLDKEKEALAKVLGVSVEDLFGESVQVNQG